MKIRLRHPRSQALLLAALLMSGCGASEISGPKSSSGGKEADAEREPKGDVEDEEVAMDELVTPPQEYYDQLFAQALALADSPSTGAKGPEILWINFDGATVTKGFGRGQSFIPCKATSTIPSPNLSAADKDAVVSLVQQFYSDVGANLAVTPNKPATGEYTTIHVGGAYRDLGCLGGSGVLGIAPFDVGNANRSDVGFAFTPSYADAQLIAETVAHEAGHSYGLDHVVTRTLLMYASAGDNITGFGVSKVSGSGRTQDEPAILKQVLGIADGSVVVPPPASSPANPTPVTPTPANPAQPTIPGLPNLPVDLANLPGLGQIANLGQLLPGLANGGVADITQIIPQLQALIPSAGAGAFPGLDQILTIVGAASQAGANPQGGATGGGIAGLPIDPAIAGAILSGATGGLGGVLGGLLGGILGGATGGTTPTTPTIPTITSLPDLSQLLNLNGAITDLPTLIASFTGSTQVVASNYSGAQRQALISMLKVAYAQQYKSLGGNP